MIYNPYDKNANWKILHICINCNLGGHIEIQSGNNVADSPDFMKTKGSVEKSSRQTPFYSEFASSFRLTDSHGSCLFYLERKIPGNTESFPQLLASPRHSPCSGCQCDAQVVISFLLPLSPEPEGVSLR